MTLSEVNEICRYKLVEISECFKPQVKLTLIARLPGNNDADFIISEDDYDEVMKALQRRKAGEK